MGRAYGEGCRIQDRVGRCLGKQVLQGRDRQRVFQRGHEDRQRVLPGAQERPDEAVDRRKPAALYESAVKDDRDDRGTRRPVILRRGKVCKSCARPIDARPQQWRRTGGAVAVLRDGCGVLQEPHCVLRPAFDQIGP